MWTRKELKERGKTAFKRNYWPSVLAALLMMLVCGGGGAGSGRAASQSSGTMDAGSSALFGIVMGIIAVCAVIGIIWNIFLAMPVCVGVNRFFLENSRQPAGIREIGYAFGGGRYFNIIGTQLVKNIFIGLWCLLLVIPGIIKAYEYRMVGFIQAEEPELGTMECLRRSKEMMKGQKWNTFVLDLSFLGWMILSGITLGIVGIFYVNPYMQATDAELYLTLKNKQ